MSWDACQLPKAQGGELEYVFEDKGMYWRDTTVALSATSLPDSSLHGSDGLHDFVIVGCHLKFYGYLNPISTAIFTSLTFFNIIITNHELDEATQEIYLPYLPYFSNCRGFGRTIPREPLAFESSSGPAQMTQALATYSRYIPTSTNNQ